MFIFSPQTHIPDSRAQENTTGVQIRIRNLSGVSVRDWFDVRVMNDSNISLSCVGRIGTEGRDTLAMPRGTTASRYVFLRVSLSLSISVCLSCQYFISYISRPELRPQHCITDSERKRSKSLYVKSNFISFLFRVFHSKFRMKQPK